MFGKTWFFLGILLVFASFFFGVNYGKRSVAKDILAASQAAQKAAQAAADQELLRLEAEAKQRELAVQLEEQAYADPVDDACGIDVDRVRRLNLR